MQLDVRIGVFKPGLDLKLVSHLGFRWINFYWRFIQGFSKIAIPLILRLKIGLSKISTSKVMCVNSNSNIDFGDSGIGRSNGLKNRPSPKNLKVQNIGCTEELSFQDLTISWLQIFMIKFKNLLFYKNNFKQVLVGKLRCGASDCYSSIQNSKALPKRL